MLTGKITEITTTYEKGKVTIRKTSKTGSPDKYTISGEYLYSHLFVNTDELLDLKYLIQAIIDEQ